MTSMLEDNGDRIQRFSIDGHLLLARISMERIANSNKLTGKLHLNRDSVNPAARNPDRLHMSEHVRKSGQQMLVLVVGRCNRVNIPKNKLPLGVALKIIQFVGELVSKEVVI